MLVIDFTLYLMTAIAASVPTYNDGPSSPNPSWSIVPATPRVLGNLDAMIVHVGFNVSLKRLKMHPGAIIDVIPLLLEHLFKTRQHDAQKASRHRAVC